MDKKMKSKTTKKDQEDAVIDNDNSSPSATDNKKSDRKKVGNESTSSQDQTKVKSQKRHHGTAKNKKKKKVKQVPDPGATSDENEGSDQSDAEQQYKRNKPPTEVLMARELFTAASETLKMAKHIRKLETKIQKLERKIQDDESCSDEDDEQCSKVKSQSTDDKSSDCSDDEPVKKKKKKQNKIRKKGKSKKKKDDPNKSGYKSNITNASFEEKHAVGQLQQSFSLSPEKNLEETATRDEQPVPVYLNANDTQIPSTSKLQAEYTTPTQKQNSSSHTTFQYLCQYCGYSLPESKKTELAEHIMECGRKYQNKSTQGDGLNSVITVTPVPDIQRRDTSTPQKQGRLQAVIEQVSYATIFPSPIKSTYKIPQNIPIATSTPCMNTSKIYVPKKAVKTYLKSTPQEQSFDSSRDAKEEMEKSLSAPLERLETSNEESEALPGTKLTVNNYVISSGLEYTCEDCGLVLAKAAKLIHNKVCKKIPICLYCSSHFSSVAELFKHKPECKKKNWQDHPVRKLQHNISVPDVDLLKQNKSKDSEANNIEEKSDDKKKMVLHVAKFEDGEKSNKRKNKQSNKYGKVKPYVDIYPESAHYSASPKPTNVFFVCLKCDQQFVSSADLRVHQGDPNLCKEWISLKSRQKGLKVASRFCYSCKKMFATQNDYTRHRRDCVGLKPEMKTYSCFTCYKTFESQSELSVHKQMNHKSTDTSNCWVCGATFPNFKEFLKHAETHKDVRSTVRKRSRPGHVRDNHHLVLRKETITEHDDTEMISPEVMNMLMQFDTQTGDNKNTGPSFVAEVSKNEEDCMRYNITVDTRGAVQVGTETSNSGVNLTSDNKESEKRKSDLNQVDSISVSDMKQTKSASRAFKKQINEDNQNLNSSHISREKTGKFPLKPDGGDVKIVNMPKSTTQKVLAKNIDNLIKDVKNSPVTVTQLGKVLQKHGIDKPVQITTNDPGVQKLLLSLQQNQKVVVGENKVGYLLKGLPKNVQVKSSKFGDIQLSKMSGVKSDGNKQFHDLLGLKRKEQPNIEMNIQNINVSQKNVSVVEGTTKHTESAKKEESNNSTCKETDQMTKVSSTDEKYQANIDQRKKQLPKKKDIKHISGDVLKKTPINYVRKLEDINQQLVVKGNQTGPNQQACGLKIISNTDQNDVSKRKQKSVNKTGGMHKNVPETIQSHDMTDKSPESTKIARKSKGEKQNECNSSLKRKQQSSDKEEDRLPKKITKVDQNVNAEVTKVVKRKHKFSKEAVGTKPNAPEMKQNKSDNKLVKENPQSLYKPTEMKKQNIPEIEKSDEVILVSSKKGRKRKNKVNKLEVKSPEAVYEVQRRGNTSNIAMDVKSLEDAVQNLSVQKHECTVESVLTGNKKMKNSKKKTLREVSARTTRSQAVSLKKSSTSESTTLGLVQQNNERAKTNRSDTVGSVSGMLVPVGDNKVKCSVCNIELTSMQDVATHKCFIDPPSSRDSILYANLGKLGKVQMIRSEDIASDEDEGEVDIVGEGGGN